MSGSTPPAGDAGRVGRGEALLSSAFVSLLETLVHDFDVVELLDRLAGTCCDLFPDVTAGLLLRDRNDRLQVAAASTEETRLLALLALQSDEGPCLDCFHSSSQVTVADLGDDPRWPRFAARARQAGYRAVHALPLRLRSDTIGALLRPAPRRSP